MATFSTLPLEIHNSIAEHCGNKDLINLCCTSKWVNEICLRVLYRNVDLRLDRYGVVSKSKVQLKQIVDECQWQQQFVHTLLSHPEYGEHVQILKGMLCVPSIDKLVEPTISEEELWRAMQSLTHVQSVDLGSRNGYAYSKTAQTKQFPNDLFQSATSVTLVGQMQSRLAQSILHAVNPAMLTYLCLDMVREIRDKPQCAHPLGYSDEEGRIISLGTPSGLLTTLTGRCTALRTLILRRLGQSRGTTYGWHATVEEASYIEWASFVHSVLGTVEKFTFEQVGETTREWLYLGSFSREPCPLSIADERFQRLMLPTIVSGNWHCLTLMELQGVSSSNGQVGKAALIKELRALLGGKTKIVVEERPHYITDFGVRALT